MAKRRLFCNLCLLTLILTGCNGPREEQHGAAYRFVGDTVYIDPGNVLKKKLETITVTEELYSKEIITAGTIQPIPTQYAYIAPPFAGRVSKSYISLGQVVKGNTPLFEVISSDFIEAQKEFFQAQSERELALKDMRRKEDLFKNGVSSQREMEEAVNLLSIAEKEYENAKAALQIYHVDVDQMVLGQPMVIRSPISGTVIENNLVTGLYLKDDTEPVAIVADLSKVWITAQVKEKDLRFIHTESEMDIHISAYPGKELKGKVFHIDEAIDEETRSVKVLSVCDNNEELLKLGMYVTIHFTDEPRDQVAIPEKALLQDEKTTYVFVAQGPDVYVKTPVEVDVTKGGKAFITSGLRKGDVIISQGGYYLK
ncbi:MAG: efflux RND transporter periplasmic adaptor subunit [Tannerellaceae bacterium]|nr:efflux RND transporter periplasmic adaptor subunit [Tannerellaceae bacterium]